MPINVRAGKNSILGVTFIENGINFAIALDVDKEPCSKKCRLFLYKSKHDQKPLKIEFPKEGICGNIYTLFLTNLPVEYIYYEIRYGENIIKDKSAKLLNYKKDFGFKGRKKILSVIYNKEFNWEDDKAPNIPKNEIIAYKMHVRGFTKNSNLKNAGTFAAIIEKIPYLKEIGINQVEFMPIYDFDEIDIIHPNITRKNKTLINYWGYKEACYFAPKYSYSYDDDAIFELKTLIKKLHEAKIEVIMEFFFTSNIETSKILDVLRYWIYEYHIDGVHLTSTSNIDEKLSIEPIFYKKKLYIEYFGNNMNTLADVCSYNDGFLVNSRHFIKGDDYSISNLLSEFMADKINKINYLAGHNGFCLSDCFSYNMKHNEKNGFCNKDGNNYNYTWNCGKEGLSRSKKILNLREKQIKNAIFILMLSRGIPLIVSGDEMGKTKYGNNNTFCQDNNISWIDWNDLEKNSNLLDFFKKLVHFRKSHIIIFSDKNLIKASNGWPFISLHSNMAWDMKIQAYSKCVGILYNGEYCIADKKICDMIYIGMNMHYEKQSLAIPNLVGYNWEMVLSTDDSCILKNNKMILAKRACALAIGVKNHKK